MIFMRKYIALAGEVLPQVISACDPFLSFRLLGALCCYICDPSVNMVNQEIKPADSLGQLLLFYLNSKSALQRISVALVICEWAALQKVRYILNKSKFSKTNFH
jgi:cytosine/uracil/thiamine/allantoin permease